MWKRSSFNIFIPISCAELHFYKTTLLCSRYHSCIVLDERNIFASCQCNVSRAFSTATLRPARPLLTHFASPLLASPLEPAPLLLPGGCRLFLGDGTLPKVHRQMAIAIHGRESAGDELSPLWVERRRGGGPSTVNQVNNWPTANVAASGLDADIYMIRYLQ